MTIHHVLNREQSRLETRDAAAFRQIGGCTSNHGFGSGFSDGPTLTRLKPLTGAGGPSIVDSNREIVINPDDVNGEAGYGPNAFNLASFVDERDGGVTAPKCKCRREPMRWSSRSTHNGFWRCAVKQREYDLRYQHSPKGRETRRRYYENMSPEARLRETMRKTLWMRRGKWKSHALARTNSGKR